MKGGNLARAVKVPGPGKLLENQIERKGCCRAAGHGASQILEADALAAQVGVGELLLRRLRFARVGDPVREPGLLRGEQHQSQQTEKEAAQFHIVLDGTPGSLTRWP